MNRRRLLTGGAAALAGFLPAAARSQKTMPVHIAITTDDASAEPLYAKELGYFTAGGLDANVEVLANGAGIIAALVAGAVDIGSSNLISAVAAFQKGVPLRIIAPAAVYDGSVPQVALVVPKASPVRTAKDLEGKTIATNPIRGISSLSMIPWMRKRGADPSAIKWVEMPRGDMVGALMQGHVDGATLTEPFISLNRSATRIVAVPYSAVASRFDTVVLLATDQWAKANSEQVRRFAAVMRKTALWANANQAKSGAILASYSKMNPALVSQMARVKYGSVLLAADVQPCIDLAVEGKLIDASFPAAQMIFQG